MTYSRTVNVHQDSNTHNNPMLFLKVKDAQIAYRRIGEGPAIIFAHCSSGNHRQWLAAARLLSASYTCYLPDFLSYGQSASQFTVDGQPIECRDYDIIDTLVNLSTEPAVLIGHSYGGAICLEYARRNPQRVKSLFAVEPVAFQLLEHSLEHEALRAITDRTEKLHKALQRGKRQTGAGIYMSFWIGRLKWWLAPRKFRASVTSTIEKVAFEFNELMALMSANDPDITAVMPVTLVSGNRSPSAAQSLVNHLEQWLPLCSHQKLVGAGHMSPMTHQADIIHLIQQHLE